MLTSLLCALGVSFSMAMSPAPAQVQPVFTPWRLPSIGISSQTRLRNSAGSQRCSPSISVEAEILVLAQDGYITAVKGRNGFVCLVERSWAKSTDDAEFWNPKVSAPHCLNAPAAKTYLPIYLLKTKLVLAGKPKAEIARGA